MLDNSGESSFTEPTEIFSEHGDIAHRSRNGDSRNDQQSLAEAPLGQAHSRLAADLGVANTAAEIANTAVERNGAASSAGQQPNNENSSTGRFVNASCSESSSSCTPTVAANLDDPHALPSEQAETDYSAPNLSVLEPRPGAGRFKSNQTLIESLTKRSQLFLFSYSPRLKTLLSWSSNSLEILGVKDSSIARDGNLFLRHVHPDDRFLLLNDLERSMKDGELYRATYRWIRPDNNEQRWLHCRAMMGTTEMEGLGTEQLLEGIIIDLSAEFYGSVHKLADADSINNILSAFPTIVMTLDRDLRIMRINRPDDKFEFTFGDPHFKLEQFKIGKQLLPCFSDQEQRNNIEQTLMQILAGEIAQHRSRVANGETVFNLDLFPITEQGVIGGVLLIISDITAVAALERQLAEVQRAEAIRLLAAGVSHNFNNALQGIIGQAAVIQQHSTNAQLVLEASQSIIEVVTRTAELTRQLTLFDEKGGTPYKRIDLNLVAMAAVNKVEDLFDSGIKISVVFGTPPLVRGPQELLVEAFQELLRNSSEALVSGDGVLSIKTYGTKLSDLEVGDLRAGEYAKLTITDTGKGMNAEQVRRCIDPFYTTKGVDPGSGLGLSGQGLGLSKALSVVRKLGGTITVDSANGHGTTVAIYLPAAEPERVTSSKELALNSALAPGEQSDEITLGETEVTDGVAAQDDSSAVENNEGAIQISPHQRHAPQVLIVDDDPLVLDTVANQIRGYGYTVITGDSFSSALAQLRNNLRSIELVLLDAIIPGVDGVAGLKQIKRLKRSVTVIGFTGAGDDIGQAMLEAGASQVLTKPVDPKVLKQTLDLLLAGPTRMNHASR